MPDIYLHMDDLDDSPLDIRFDSFDVKGKKRILSLRKDNLQPVKALSIYECYLSSKTNSWGAVETHLRMLSYIFTWAFRNNYDIERDLFTGSIPLKRNIRAFKHWMRQRRSNRTLSAIELSTINSALTYTCTMFVYFIEQYAKFSGSNNEQAINSEIVTNSLRRLFKDEKLKERKKKIAPDLSEDEIGRIEAYLKPENRLKSFSKAPKPEIESEVHRDYLMWRLAIELGLRLGEILALRIEDCPNKTQNHIEIVRIEDRDADYIDPRDKPPRPKTLSRSLGFLIKDTPLPGLINDYISTHRFRRSLRRGKTVRRPVMDKPHFLILSHGPRDQGNPLSISSAETIAQRISKQTGVEFHWHLTRHAFFNRGWAAIADNPSKALKADLVYWGGWEREDSLDIYIKRALKERAQKALMFWQENGNEWRALS